MFILVGTVVDGVAINILLVAVGFLPETKYELKSEAGTEKTGFNANGVVGESEITEYIVPTVFLLAVTPNILFTLEIPPLIVDPKNNAEIELFADNKLLPLMLIVLFDKVTKSEEV